MEYGRHGVLLAWGQGNQPSNSSARKMAAGTSTVDPFPFFSNELIRAARRQGPKVGRNLEMNVPAELVFDTVARYMVLIGIADERWKISAARNWPASI